MSFGAGFELFDAASVGNLDTIRTILATNPSAARANFRLHVTPVHCAARYNQLEALRLLLVPGVAIDAANRRGWSALHCATEHGNLDAMRLLLDAGAQVDTASTSGSTALFLAVQRGNLAAARLLIARGASAAALDMTSAGPLHYAKETAMIELLLKVCLGMPMRS